MKIKLRKVECSMTANLSRQKSELRKMFLGLRANLNPEDRRLQSETISHSLLNWIQNLQNQQQFSAPSQTIALYAAMRSEVSLSSLGVAIRKLGIATAYPRCFANREMQFYLVDNEDLLEPSKFGVPEPAPEEDKLVSPEKLDIMLIPGIAFTQGGLRLGYGGGFYDKYLAQPELRALRVGVGYDLQLVESLPQESFDCKLDYIATGAKVVSCR